MTTIIPNRGGRKARQSTIHEKYRQILNRPDLTVEEIEAMRKHMILLAQTICEHVWGKKVH
jgi:hypothetical protein